MGRVNLSSGSNPYPQSAQSFNLNEWVHGLMAVSWVEGRLKIFTDGTLSQNYFLGTQLTHREMNSNPWSIGSSTVPNYETAANGIIENQ